MGLLPFVLDFPGFFNWLGVMFFLVVCKFILKIKFPPLRLGRIHLLKNVSFNTSNHLLSCGNIFKFFQNVLGSQWQQLSQVSPSTIGAQQEIFFDCQR